MDLTHCLYHKERTLDFYCLETSCIKLPLCCILCIKNSHKICREEYILEKETAHQRINFMRAQFISKENIERKLNQVFELKIYETNKALMVKKKNFINEFFIFNNEIELFKDKDFSVKFKKNFNIELDSETNKIKLTPKLNATPEVLEESLQKFKSKLDEILDNLIKEFSRLNFFRGIHETMNVADWSQHANIQISAFSQGINFKRTQDNNTFNYFCAIYNKPLTMKSKFKITVENIYEHDRFVDIGIVPKSKLQALKNTYINNYSAFGISFCGYSFCGGLQGISWTTEANDNRGCKPGSCFYLYYEPQVELRYNDEEGKLDLFLNMDKMLEEYFLFAVLYHPPVEFSIEQIF